MNTREVRFKMPITDLCERLDNETGCSGLSDHLKELIGTDASPIEEYRVVEELYEGGTLDYDKGEWSTPPTYIIESFVIWTRDFIYHSYTSEDAHLFEVGTVFKVPRNPQEATKEATLDT